MVDRGPHLLPRQIAKLCYEAGWSDADKLLIAVSVCLAESNGYYKARHVNDDSSVDRGLWMLNDRFHPDITDAEAYDPEVATRWARKMYVNDGMSFKEWKAYTNGAYKSDQALGYAYDGVSNMLRVKHGVKL